jgi:hypothetical protein
MCPGNNESAGKQYSGRTRQGNSWLRAALGEAAIAVTRSKNNYLIARHSAWPPAAAVNAPWSPSSTAS